MKILCLGDVVGRGGRAAVFDLLKSIKKEYSIDFSVINAENTAGGSGITTRIAKAFFHNDADVLTIGDHIWDQKELEPYLEEKEFLLRPANFPQGAPGRGWCIKTLADGRKVGVINLLGRVFMRYNVSCPFVMVDDIIATIKKETPIIVFDFHAETTSETIAMGHYVDGRISAVFGTHTHVQTADEKVLGAGTAFITDAGMCGPVDSVIGQDKQKIITRYLTSRPVRFEVAQGDCLVQGIVVDIDDETGQARSIERIQKPYAFKAE